MACVRPVSASGPAVESDRCDPSPASPERAVSSSTLLAGRRVLVIRHADEDYRLRVTRSGKLILTK
ncbi:MAG: hemin uptake protein HemP [Acetobacteraceae bacterium]|nr:hemin uptake protein HemP [Acetobacteraceae bacterium]